MDDYQLDYEKYYENMTGDTEPPKKRGKAGKVLGFATVAVVFLVVGMLIAGLVQSMRDPWEIQLPDMPPRITPHVTAAPTATPAPTPRPTERPMASLDGVAPYLPGEGNPIPDMIDGVKQSVVGILNYAEDITGLSEKDTLLQGMGTGFFISSEGYIITNAHVVEGAYSVAIELIDGREIDAEITGIDPASDVAVLKVSHANVTPLKLGDSDGIRVGDYAVAVGNPLGRGLEGTVTMGIISARARIVPIDGNANLYIQTDAAINLGNSGGPLLNMRGEVIGVNTAKTINAGYDEYGMAINAEGLGFALPINSVQLIVTQLITKGYVQRAVMGVQIIALSRNELIDKGLDGGILVDSVVRGGPAAQAGIRPEDIILSCDGMTFSNQQELVEYVNMLPVGTKLTVELWREGERLTVQVNLTDKSGLDYADSEAAQTPAPEEE